MAGGYRRRYRGRRRDARAVAAAMAAGVGVAVLAHASGGHRGPVLVPAAAVPASVAGNVALGERMAAARGWTGVQWRCLYALWSRESGWSNTAENSSSGAYGIAQALGHGPTNQYPAGPANPPRSDPRAQVRWGLGDIASVYGSPCAAWAHEQAAGWY